MSVIRVVRLQKRLRGYPVCTTTIYFITISATHRLVTVDGYNSRKTGLDNRVVLGLSRC